MDIYDHKTNLNVKNDHALNDIKRWVGNLGDIMNQT